MTSEIFIFHVQIDRSAISRRIKFSSSRWYFQTQQHPFNTCFEKRSRVTLTSSGRQRLLNLFDACLFTGLSIYEALYCINPIHETRRGVKSCSIGYIYLSRRTNYAMEPCYGKTLNRLNKRPLMNRGWILIYQWIIACATTAGIFICTYFRVTREL